MKKTTVASYILAGIAIIGVLVLHLLPALFAGLAVYVLTDKIAGKLSIRSAKINHELALAAIALIVIAGTVCAGLGLSSLLGGQEGLSALLQALVKTMEDLRRHVPEAIGTYIPGSVDSLKDQAVGILKENAKHLSLAGVEGLKHLVHVAFGMIIGGMLALGSCGKKEKETDFVKDLKARVKGLAGSFDKVVFAQVKISAINTALTAAYLGVALPMCGYHMPLGSVLILLTFVLGMIPVAGNVVSNFIIVVMSLSVSPAIALSSLVFLVAIHKLEYLTNAKVIGSQVHAKAWELITAMLVMEAVFGILGVVAAPVAYAWLKAELRAAELI